MKQCCCKRPDGTQCKNLGEPDESDLFMCSECGEYLERLLEAKWAARVQRHADN